MDNSQDSNPSTEKKAIDLFIKLNIVALLIAWSVMIVLPFAITLLWGIILAVSLYPLFKILLKLVKGKKAIASSIITIVLLCVILVPSIFMITSIIGEIKGLKEAIDSKALVIPPPNAKVAGWPIVGKKIYEAWSLLNSNLESAVVKYKDQIESAGQKFVGAIRGLFSNIMMFSLSIIIMGVLFAYADAVKGAIGAFMKKLLGNNSQEYTMVVIQTVRNVAKGILGVAFIQFIIMGISFVLAGVPFAGVWALLVFLLALVQLPGALVAIPVIIYIYSVKEPLPATIWAVIILICGLSDNVLKPLLMGKGAPVPMLVIFLGALGGFMLSGFIGLFTGAIVLSLTYKLGGMWMQNNGSGYSK
jgi:predicted PurR-regulated permease PerM